VREEREAGVEQIVGEGKLRGVGADESLRVIADAIFGEAQLIGRDVDSDDRPAQLGKLRNRDACSAAEIQARSGAGSEESRRCFQPDAGHGS
jgi:hypothetical protein